MKNILVLLVFITCSALSANAKKTDQSLTNKKKQNLQQIKPATKAIQSLEAIEAAWHGKPLNYRCCNVNCCKSEAEKFLSCDNKPDSFFIANASIGTALEQCHYTADTIVLKDGTKISFIKDQVAKRISKTNLLNLRWKFVNCEQAKLDSENTPDKNKKAAAIIYLEKNACIPTQVPTGEKISASEKATTYQQAKDMAQNGNLADSKRLYLKLCEIGEMLACGAYGDLQDQTMNTNDAIIFTKKACDGGEVKYCEISKKYEEKLKVVASNPRKQKQLADMDAMRPQFINSCAQNDMNACYSLAAIEYQLGNKAEAKKNAEKACQNKLAEACSFLKQINASGN